ncbi:MAG: acetyl-CoA carboxylase biotin carboxyl carrier protein subunit [Bacteroidia bacterium]|nr:acetyl-CoA carboxylase biotin carboxyl carrier protein subunit [Bacteroidia bacterium]MDW8158136.1 acetyl-CoA carboxylase biotin carboxyl carrier protein subunit [Bacteroidia bacterium]
MLKVEIDQKQYTLHKEYETLYLDQEPVAHQIRPIDDFSYEVRIGNRGYILYTTGINPLENTFSIRINGKKVIGKCITQKQIFLQILGLEATAGQKIQELKAPMPGLIRAVHVGVGEKVSKGQIILVLEAMKMENALKSPGEGIVKQILINQGQAVEKNQLLIVFE